MNEKNDWVTSDYWAALDVTIARDLADIDNEDRDEEDESSER